LSADLDLLIARFRWPIAATRWWAMQELAALLLSPETQEEVSKQLLAELARCRLEAETVELICIFWMAANQGYKPPSDLVSALTHPSLLAALLLRDIKLDLRKGPSPPLEMAPDDFDVPARFRDMHGMDIPRIYFTRLTQLERDTGLPFVRQCAFEWSRTEGAYPRAPLQGDLDYFVRPLGDGATGGFASRTMLRMLTAYQRTLDVARVFWGAPERFLLPLVVEALPFDPTLAFLRPTRPSWLPNLGEKVTADAAISVEGFIRSMSDSLSATQPGAVLLALVSPTCVNSHEIVELSIVRWRQWGSTAIDASQLGARFHDRQERWDYGVCNAPIWGLKTSVPAHTLEDVLDHETNAAPMAAVYGFSRIGYLQRDLYPSRLYYPVTTGRGQLAVEPTDGELRISAAQGPMAMASYWNAGWSPAHPNGMSGLCGTALVQTSDSRQAQSEPPPDGHFYLWRTTRLKRSNNYEPFVLDEPVYGVVRP